MPGILTLTTDFGLRDHYVGVMKGVILKIHPSARIVDISHEIAPFQVNEAAYVIGESYRWFPTRTVHVVVVDPGVGSARRPIVVEAAGQFFVGPDNGVFSLVLARHLHKVRHITNRRLFLSEVSQTFQGRDVFAPVGAHLARGGRPAQVGKQINDYCLPSTIRPVQMGPGEWTGTVLKVDRFGNLVTNFHREEFPELQTMPFVVNAGGHRIQRLIHCFAECPPGEAALILGSAGYYELVANQTSAAQLLACDSGSLVEVKRR